MEKAGPVIVELCGMPAAGKSTVCGRIRSDLRGETLTFRIPVRHKWATGALEMLRLSPLVVQLGCSGLFVKRLKSLVHLRVLYRSANSHQRLTSETILLDPGPIYSQAFALSIASSFRPMKCLTSWIVRNVSDWSDALTGIVWLDAREEMLLERVCRRDQEHSLKTRTDAERREFIDGYLAAYRWLISMYEGAGIPVLRLSTEEDDVGMTSDKIMQFITGLRAGEQRTAVREVALGECRVPQDAGEGV